MSNAELLTTDKRRQVANQTTANDEKHGAVSKCRRGADERRE
jgi:hypothetical protein